MLDSFIFRPFQTSLGKKIVGFVLEQMADDIRLVTITLLNCHNAHQKLTGQEGCMEGRQGQLRKMS